MNEWRLLGPNMAILNIKWCYFGLSNTSASFEGYINKILAEKLDIFVIVNLDNILIYTDEVIYINSIWWILNQLWMYSLYANQRKCQFYQESVRFIEYVISL